MKLVEGVPYYRFAVRFTMAGGKRVRWVRWSPGKPWVYEEVIRELCDRGIEPQHIVSKRITIEAAPCV